MGINLKIKFFVTKKEYNKSYCILWNVKYRDMKEILEDSQSLGTYRYGKMHINLPLHYTIHKDNEKELVNRICNTIEHEVLHHALAWNILKSPIISDFTQEILIAYLMEDVDKLEDLDIPYPDGWESINVVDN